MSATDDERIFDCNRRDFLKVAGLGAVALTVPGMAMTANSGVKPVSLVKQEEIETDVLVIGGGFAGVFGAVKAREKGVDVTMAVKGYVGRSGMTPWGDAFLVFNKGSHNKKEWLKLFQMGGDYLTNLDYANLQLDYSSKIYNDLVSWNALKNKAEAFRDKVRDMGINLIERVVMTDLLTDGSRVAGAIGFPFEEDRVIVIKARSVVMATGAGAYKPAGFPLSSLTFDGDAMAYKLGAEITGKEFNDTHDTQADYPADCWQVRNFIQKAPGVHYGPLNLEGAFAAHQGQIPWVRPRPPRPEGPPHGGRPMGPPPGRPPMGLGPRPPSGPSVGGASGGHAGHKTEGIWPTDSRCGTSITGLFAAGDALGSMQCGAMYHAPGVSGCGSCAQGWVAGERAAGYAKGVGKPPVSTGQIAELKKDMLAAREREKGYSPAWVTQVLQNLMIPYYVTLVKKENRLKAALTNIEFLRDHFVPKLKAEDTHELRLVHDTKNMIQNAEMKLRVSLFRTESRGTHFREDYPARDDENWLAWILIKDNNGKMELSKKPVPKEWGPDMSLPYERRYPYSRFPGELEYAKKLKL